MTRVLLLVVFLVGCGGAVDERDVLAQTDSALVADGVQVLNAGLWTRSVGGSACASYPPACLRELNLWVDLKVPNRCFQKQVGIAWKDNLYNVPVEGTAWPVATARYERALPDGFEQWGVDLTVATINGRQPDEVVVQLAAFATQCGGTSWDNNNGANHQVR